MLCYIGIIYLKKEKEKEISSTDNKSTGKLLFKHFTMHFNSALCYSVRWVSYQMPGGVCAQSPQRRRMCVSLQSWPALGSQGSSCTAFGRVGKK